MRSEAAARRGSFSATQVCSPDWAAARVAITSRASYVIALLRKINNSRVTRKHGVRCRRLHGCFFFLLTSCTVSAAIFFNVFMDDNKQGGSKEPREGTSVHIKNRHTHTNRAKCEYCCPFQLFFYFALSLTRHSEMHNNEGRLLDGRTWFDDTETKHRRKQGHE